VRLSIFRAMRYADPTSSNEMVENVGDIRSGLWRTSRIEFDSARTKK
jgi:hypothetical protein